MSASHTGSMAGRAAAYDAMFERYGVATVRTPAELLETLKMLDIGGPLGGPRVVSLSCSGGEASLVADRAEATGLRFEPFADAQRERIVTDAQWAAEGASRGDYWRWIVTRTALSDTCFR